MFAEIAILGGLALVDSTSIGTLFIPLWLLLAPGMLRVGRVGLFLVAIAGLYFAIGIALMLGADVSLGWIQAAFGEGGLLDTSPVNGALFAIGLALLAISFRKSKPQAGPSRVARWREKTLATQSMRGVVLLAAVAAGLEVFTMLPYLAAVGYLAAQDMNWAPRVGWLAFYCFVMILPALFLIVMRVLLRDRADQVLVALNSRLDKVGNEMALWVIGIAGFVLAGFAGQRLFEL